MPLDPFTPEAIIRLWLLCACLATLLVLAGVLGVSRGLDRFLSRRERAVHGSSRTVSSVAQLPAAAPAFDPVLPGSRYRIGSRLARVLGHHEAPHALHAGHSGVRSLAGVPEVLAGRENGDR